MTGRRWYVVQVKQAQEQLVAIGLREQEFDVYVPKTFRRERVGHAMKPVAHLRFPNYVFVSFDANQESWGPVNNTRGVDHLFCDAAGKPEPMRDWEIAGVRNAEEQEFHDASRSRKSRSRRNLASGSQVTIMSGPWAGQTGRLVAVMRGQASVLIGGLKITMRDTEIDPVEQGKHGSRAA